MSQLLVHSETLFVIDDIIADKSLDKRRQFLLELAISGRYRSHYLWLLTQSYSATPGNSRRQAKAIFVWYPKERADLKIMQDEKNVLTNYELVLVREFLCCLKIMQSTKNGSMSYTAKVLCPRRGNKIAFQLLFSD